MKFIKQQAYILLFYTGLCGCVYAEQQSSLPSTVTAKFSPPTDEWGNVRPPSLGGFRLTIYTEPANTQRRKYYVKPYFLPDLEQFKKDITLKCEKSSENDIFSVPLTFELTSSQVEDEILKEIKKEDTNVSLSRLSIYPFTFFSLATGGRSNSDDIPTIIRLWYPDSVLDRSFAEPIANRTTIEQNVGSNPPVIIEDTCAQLQAIANNSDMFLQIYTQFEKVKKNTIGLTLQQFLHSDSLTSLLRDETQSGSQQTVVKSKSGGVGFNLGGIVGGENSVDTKNTDNIDSRTRAVSSNLLQDAIHESISKMKFSQRIAFEDGSNIEQSIVNMLLEMMKSNPLEFHLKLISKNQIEITSGQFKRTLDPLETKSLIDSTRDSQLDFGEEGSFKYGEILEGTNKKSNKSVNKGGIKWEKDGPDWIPTSATLYLVSRATLSNSISAELERYLVSEGSGYLRHVINPILEPRAQAYWGKEMNKVRKETEQKIMEKVYGPQKKVTKIQGGIYRTRSHWSNGRSHRDTLCINTPSQPPGTVKIGGNDTGIYDTRKSSLLKDPNKFIKSLGCKPRGHCDSHGEFCISYERQSGCYVNKEWFDWYKKREESLGRNVDHNLVCRN
ncbi:MAG: hypothetical protein G8D66_00545 [gamma proteobacterium symbiont of Ctena orbiculata]